MGLPLTVQGDRPTCNAPDPSHINTGSSKVFIQGKGVTRVQIDSVAPGGFIVGPGSPTITCEGFPVSIPGDIIAPHPGGPYPKAGTGIHPAAVILADQNTVVTAGFGFAESIITNAEGEQVLASSEGDEEEFDAPVYPAPNLEVTKFESNYVTLNCWNTGQYPPDEKYNDTCCKVPQYNYQIGFNDYWYDCIPQIGKKLPKAPPWYSDQGIKYLRFSWTVKNTGISPSKPFTFGIWKLPTDKQQQSLPFNFNALLNTGFNLDYPAWEEGKASPNDKVSTLFNSISLSYEKQIPTLEPGEEYSGVFEITDALYVNGIAYLYSCYADIYRETIEPSENNTSIIKKINITNDCIFPF